MHRIDKIIEKYLEGTSDLNEERELKSYLSSEEMDARHVYLKTAFGYFDSEARRSAPSVSKPKKSRVHKWIIYSAAAASVALAVQFFYFSDNENYVIRNGKKIVDKELAQSIALEKLNKVNGIMARNLEPVQRLNTVRTTLSKYRKGLEKTEKLLNKKN